MLKMRFDSFTASSGQDRSEMRLTGVHRNVLHGTIAPSRDKLLAIRTFDALPRLLEIGLPVGRLRPFNGSRWIDFDYQKGLRRTIGDFGELRAFVLIKHSLWANRNLERRFSLTIQLSRFRAKVHVSSRHLFDQRTIVRAVPRL